MKFEIQVNHNNSYGSSTHQNYTTIRLEMNRTVTTWQLFFNLKYAYNGNKDINLFFNFTVLGL